MSVIGSIHGRFQPFHNEHLEYAIGALNRCDFLWIGISIYDISSLSTTEQTSYRSTPEANPFTYTERVIMIRNSLLELGYNHDKFEFTPFPIDNPENLSSFLSKNVICFTTLREKWNFEKMEKLIFNGYKVEVLKEDYSQKKISGDKIREMITCSDVAWREMVPKTVSEYIDQLTENRVSI